MIFDLMFAVGMLMIAWGFVLAAKAVVQWLEGHWR